MNGLDFIDHRTIETCDQSVGTKRGNEHQKVVMVDTVDPMDVVL